MELLFFEQIQCPYCGELIPLRLDGSSGDQSYVEDCSVCCRPIEFMLEAGPDLELVSLTARRDDD